MTNATPNLMTSPEPTAYEPAPQQRAAPLSPYHRLARTAASRWWRPIAGTLLIAVAGGGLGLGGWLAVTAAAAIAGRPDGADGVPSFGAPADLGIAFLSIAALLPGILLAARWVQRRPAGTLSSVTGRLRWGWLLTCLPVAFLAVGLLLVVATAVSPSDEADPGLTDGLTEGLAGWGPFTAAALVLLLVVPVQAAAEEYLCRGWLLQAAGTWLRGPWIPIAFQAVVFAALHGYGTPWGFADLLVFAVVAGWLTVRTGGLEAAIALHLMNNLLSSVVAAAYGDLSTAETATDLPWQLVAIDVPMIIAYAAVVRWLARRRDIATRSPA